MYTTELRPLLARANSNRRRNDHANGNVTSEYDPILYRNVEHPTSNFDTMVHLLNGNIGTGVLAMPQAFKNAGLYVGLFGTLLMGLICTHCMNILVQCSHELCRRFQISSLDYAEVCQKSFESGPHLFRPFSKCAKRICNTFLFSMQIGFCCVYFVFVAVNLQQMTAYYGLVLDVKIFLALLLVPLLILNLVKNLKYLTPISFFAAFSAVLGISAIFYYTVRDLDKIKVLPKVSTLSQLPLYFGTAIYSFEGVGIVLPLENNMKNPREYLGWNGVLNTSMVIVICLYTTVGFFGYLKYDDAVLPSITMNLPMNELLAQIVSFTIIAAIFFSYALQFYVAISILKPWIREKLDADILGENLLRVTLVFVTFFVALVFEENLGGIISLVGALSTSALALVIPPIIEIITFWHDGLGIYLWVFWKDLAIIVFGVTGFIFGSYSSFLEVLRPYL